MKRAAGLCLGLCVMVTPLVHAQAQDRWTDKAFVNFSVGGQAGSHTLDAVETFEIYNELATVVTAGCFPNHVIVKEVIVQGRKFDKNMKLAKKVN